ncbi:Rrf2 family transcriptional regulator [Magnetovibrio blakemorei]|uniref:Rrf2 family transcriptional regulator n=1 Tax=Magnetovibrio blakemorei TaxID=28181 RepID=A0A1E5Q523_9PROT|nr:Rrf2 family transcriptional regulator [Magnetovibrio blakemorei]OEJ65301.1 Rrf2 family transcriptional regulator [Magnetovibrio blakemorei]
MRLTAHTDYALRVLIYLGLQPNRMATIREISDRYELSRDHLMKIAQKLSNAGFIETVRGKNGGIRLGRDPGTVLVGDIVRTMEGRMDLVECHGKGKNTCLIVPVCILQNVMHEALEAFLNVLDQYTLADLLHPSDALTKLVQLDVKYIKSA